MNEYGCEFFQKQLHFLVPKHPELKVNLLIKFLIVFQEHVRCYDGFMREEGRGKKEEELTLKIVRLKQGHKYLSRYAPLADYFFI